MPTRIMLAAAALWALGIVGVAMTAPVYRGESTGGSITAAPGTGPTTFTSSWHATLVQVNGFKVLIPAALPLFAVALATVALTRRRRASRSGPGPIVSTVVVVLGIGTLAAILSLGVFVVPVDVLLVGVCIRASDPRPRTVVSGQVGGAPRGQSV